MQKMMNIQIALTEMCIYLDTSWIIAVHICPNTLRSNHQCQANEPFSRAHNPAYIFYLGWIPRKSNQNGIIHEYNAFLPPPPSLWYISSMQTSDTNLSLWLASPPPGPNPEKTHPHLSVYICYTDLRLFSDLNAASFIMTIPAGYLWMAWTAVQLTDVCADVCVCDRLHTN